MMNSDFLNFTHESGTKSGSQECNAGKRNDQNGSGLASDDLSATFRKRMAENVAEFLPYMSCLYVSVFRKAYTYDCFHPDYYTLYSSVLISRLYFLHVLKHFCDGQKCLN